MELSNPRWYVVQARAGFEKSVAKAIRERITRFALENEFGEVLVPSEEVVEMKDGQKRKSERKFFPGYVLIQVDTDGAASPAMSSEAWHLIKETPKVSSFIGGTADRPAPITDAEADRILSRVAASVDKPRPKVLFENGQLVRVVDGPFNDFNGVVEGIDYDKAKVRVAVLIFGRSTPIDLGFEQVVAA